MSPCLDQWFNSKTDKHESREHAFTLPGLNGETNRESSFWGEMDSAELHVTNRSNYCSAAGTNASVLNKGRIL